MAGVMRVMSIRLPVAAPLWMVMSGVVVSLLSGVVSASAAPVTTRVSVATSGAQARKASVPDGISADGRLVLFESASRRLVQERHKPHLGRVPPPPNQRAHTTYQCRRRRWIGERCESRRGDHARGPLVLFDSGARNLTRAPTMRRSVFVRDRRRRVTRLVSIKPGGGLFIRGTWGDAISDNGRYVLFGTNGGAYLRDLQRGRTRRIARRQPAKVVPLGLSPNGRFFAFTSLSGKNLRVHDRATGHTFRVPVPARWVAFQPVAFSRGDRYLFVSVETTPSFAVARWKLGAPHVRNLTSSATDAILEGISSDARYFAFESEDSTLVPGDTNGSADVFRQDVATGAVERVNLDAAGHQIRSGVSFVFQSFMARSGAWVTFDAKNARVVAGDTNGVIDVFERGPLA